MICSIGLPLACVIIAVVWLGTTDASDVCNGVIEVVGGNAHTCAVLEDKTARCWGFNSDGQLGDGTNTSSYVPVMVSGLSNAHSISAGFGYTCAVVEEGTAHCWGSNQRGQLGDGTNTNSKVPVVVSNLSNVRSISSGAKHTCAVLTDGTARCWGYNGNGQLGDGTRNDSNVPVIVSGLSTVRSISAGHGHTCAVLADGTARCWGGGSDGQLGAGTIRSSLVPTVVLGLSSARNITADYWHTCAVLQDNTVNCWGDNTYGILGDGTRRSTPVPIVVPGMTDVRSISARGMHTCGILWNGTARCWGSNWHGQLGAGTNYGGNVPVTVSGLSNVHSISAGFEYTCAVLADGTARCWGHNGFGELGDGTNTSRNEPVVVSGCTLAPTMSNYTECRQVIADEALVIYSKPCYDATYSLKVPVARCERFEYLAAAKPRGSECASQGDFNCWIEVIYNGSRGWIAVSTGASCNGGNNASDTALVAYCPAAGCPNIVPPSTCWQVVHDEVLTMKQGPCLSSATVFVGNTPVELVRGATFNCTNTNSKQTSTCGTGAAFGHPDQALCWVQGSYKGASGWLPVSRGTFKDAFCSANPQATQTFVAESCGCHGGLPALPTGALPWSSSCEGQATCTTQCDIYSGYSGGPISVQCNTTTSTWGPLSSSCSATACLPGYGGALCKPCAPGSYSLGGSSAPCANCTCPQPSPCKQQRLCDSTKGSCQLAPAADGTACRVGTLPGTCKNGYCSGSRLTCTSLPTAGKPVNSLGWKKSCKGMGHGASCTAACKGGFAGTPQPTVTCVKGKWSKVVGQCVQLAPHMECRQALSGLQLRQRPCKDAALLGDIPRCERVTYFAAAKPRVSECAADNDFSCWIEVLYNDMRGWVMSSTGTLCDGGDPTGTAFVAYCLANGCPSKAPSSSTTCRQVVHNETLTMKEGPCYGSATVKIGASLLELVRGDTFTYNNTDSKQTSMCRTHAPSDPVGATLCWIQGTFKGATGWLPIARGTFKDALCTEDISAAAQSFVAAPCAHEMYTECRQVLSNDELRVYVAPCSSDRAGLDRTLAPCSRFEYVVGETVTKCSGAAADTCEWIKMRYEDQAGRRQVGWVTAACSGIAKVAQCPADACLKEDYSRACRQVISKDELTLRDKPCWSAAVVSGVPNLKLYDTFQYLGADGKMSSACSSVTGTKGYDGLCWVKAKWSGKIGWLPVGRLLGTVTSAFCTSTKNGEAFVRELCDKCAGKLCPMATSDCLRAPPCDIGTGLCPPQVPYERGWPCSSKLYGQCDGAGACQQQAPATNPPPTGPVNSILDSAFKLKPAELASITKGVIPTELVQLQWHATSFMLGVMSEAAYYLVQGSPLFTQVLEPAGFSYAKDISEKVDFFSWEVFSKPVVDAQCVVLSSSTDIVVAVRGSNSLEDWFMTNLDIFDGSSNFLPDPFPSAGMKVWPYNSAAKVHPGFYEAALALSTAVKASINTACSQNPQASNVWLTGHSMGGAVAVLLAAMLQDSGFIAAAGSSSRGSHSCATKLAIVGVFGFESPKVGDAAFSAHYTNIGIGSQTLVHVYGGDPVPQMPPPVYQHAAALVLYRRSLSNPDITITTGPGPASILPSLSDDTAFGDHKAEYWLPPLRNLVTTTCNTAVAKQLVTSCPDFAKLAAYVVKPRDEVAAIRGSVFYLDTTGTKRIPTGEFTVTCYDYDVPTAAALLMKDREVLCTTKGVDGTFNCRYHRKIGLMTLLWGFVNLGVWDVATPKLDAFDRVVFDTTEKQTWPDIECDIKPHNFLTGTYTGRLSSDQQGVVYDAGAIELNPDRSAACKPNGCGPSGDIWFTHVPAERLVPETWFTNSCANHDCCYATCGVTKKQCDDEFLRNMEWECYQLTSASERLRCMASAPFYHAAVTGFGSSAFQKAQIENFCVGPSAVTAAIFGKLQHIFEPLVHSVVTCYDIDEVFNDLMCKAKTDDNGAFKCYYYMKTSGSGETWDSTPFFYGPDIGCSVRPAQDGTFAFDGETDVLALTEDSDQGDINVGTIEVTDTGDIYKG